MDFVVYEVCWAWVLPDLGADLALLYDRNCTWRARRGWRRGQPSLSRLIHRGGGFGLAGIGPASC